MILVRHKPIVTEIDFCAWLSQAIEPRSSPLANGDRLELIQVASRARWASNKRLVHLVPRRLGDFAFIDAVGGGCMTVSELFDCKQITGERVAGSRTKKITRKKCSYRNAAGFCGRLRG